MQGGDDELAIAPHHTFGQTPPQMTDRFDRIAARGAPALFVLLWSTGFIGTKYAL
jgi:hypothetical protein